jgi:hypothetical protein
MRELTMRRLVPLTLAIALFSVVCSCPAADLPGPTQSSGSASPTTSTDPTATDIKPVEGDDYGCVVVELYRLARWGCSGRCPQPGAQQSVSPCDGSGLVCRLNAIDTIGGFVKSPTAVQCLAQLLRQQCCLCADSPCGGDIDSILVALHAINALKNIGANAKCALAAINCACCISPDLTGAISEARAKILAPPKQKAAKTKQKKPKATDAQKNVEAALKEVEDLTRPRPTPCQVAAAIDNLKKKIKELEKTQPAAAE